MKAKGSAREAVEIPMGTNQAYESVDVHYEAVGKGREARVQDEAIYETPTV